MHDRVNRLRQVLGLLSEPNRLKILYGLGLKCRPVTDIIAETKLTQTNVSFHLRQLRDAGLVRAERRGKFIYYCLYDHQVLDALDNLLTACDAPHGRQTRVKAAANGGSRLRTKTKSAVLGGLQR